jgi:hypothetical protein
LGSQIFAKSSGIVPKHDARVLEQLIRDKVGEHTTLTDKADWPKVFCVSTYTKRSPPDPILLRSYDYPDGVVPLFPGIQNMPVWKAARATSAAPYYFDPFHDGSCSPASFVAFV